MRTSNKMLKPISGGREPKERFSLRIQDGIEIYEHETVEFCRIRKPSGFPFSRQEGPRLVVAESDRTARPLLNQEPIRGGRPFSYSRFVACTEAA